jgi:adenosylmethionine-8-amino-7-oxononanoate aminotransferase
MKKQKNEKAAGLSEKELLEIESKYCSFGDTVHYAHELRIFNRSEGIYLYDENNTQFLDLQMWYSAVNFGYKNQRLNEVLKDQIDTLPQLACQYLHKENREKH